MTFQIWVVPFLSAEVVNLYRWRQFYYNLACVYAESNDKEKCFETLDKAISFKSNMIQGEKFPDPMSDSSFKKYVDDSEFIKIVSKIKL
jgi:hypothetical protein